jgi:hypothetical protein
MPPHQARTPLVLLDSTHRKWIVAAAAVGVGAVGLHAALSWSTPGGLTGGSTVGLWYGVAGSALMFYAGLLSALRKVPSWWWIGSRQTWMRGHIWLGLLGGVLILCHSGYRWGGPLEIALWIVLIAILATGVYGLLLQQVLPRLMTQRVPYEASYEQLPHLYGVLRRRAEELVEAAELLGATLPSPAPAAAAQKGASERPSEVRRFHDEVVRPFLDQPTRRSPLSADLRAEAAFGQLRARMGLAAVKDHFTRAETLFDAFRALLESSPEQKDVLPKAEAAFKKVRDNLLALLEVEGLGASAQKTLQELPGSARAAGLALELRKLCQDRCVAELEAICRERRGYAAQERIHRWLHGWLLVHVPLSLALLVLGALHAVLSLYY